MLDNDKRLNELAEQIKEQNRLVGIEALKALKSAIQVGRGLSQCKQECHKYELDWIGWALNGLHFSPEEADLYIQLAMEFGDNVPNVPSEDLILRFLAFHEAHESLKRLGQIQIPIEECISCGLLFEDDGKVGGECEECRWLLTKEENQQYADADDATDATDAE